MTPTKQTPNECKHYCHRLCLKSGRPLGCRRTKHPDKCPDYEPKEER